MAEEQRMIQFLVPHFLLFHASKLAVPEGATAWDEDDGDVSKRILSCPPLSCMPFNCPGHELFRKGLSGCGIDTVNAPVGTVFGLKLAVSDLSVPPATFEVVRRIIVVSPCGQGQTYCPALAQPAVVTSEFACGTTDCTSRASLLSLQPAEPPPMPPDIEFSKTLPVSAISNRSAGWPMFNGSVYGRRPTIHSLVCCPFVHNPYIAVTNFLLVNKNKALHASILEGFNCTLTFFSHYFGH
jgi:hypothetical protein